MISLYKWNASLKWKLIIVTDITSLVSGGHDVESEDKRDDLKKQRNSGEIFII